MPHRDFPFRIRPRRRKEQIQPYRCRNRRNFNSTMRCVFSNGLRSPGRLSKCGNTGLVEGSPRASRRATASCLSIGLRPIAAKTLSGRVPKSLDVGRDRAATCCKAVPSNPCSSAETAIATNCSGSMPPRTHRACKSSGSRLLPNPLMKGRLNHQAPLSAWFVMPET